MAKRGGYIYNQKLLKLRQNEEEMRVLFVRLAKVAINSETKLALKTGENLALENLLLVAELFQMKEE